MRKINVLAWATIVLALGSAPRSQAAVIDFNSHPTDYANPAFDSGFTFAFDAAGWGIFGPGPDVSESVNYNGTPALYADGDRVDGRGNASVLMFLTGGGTFDVSSFLAATYWTESTGTVDVIGNLNGGGTVSASFSLTSTFELLLLPSTFTNLDSLMFRDSASGQFLETPGFGIDNIDTSPAAVPEPGSLSFLGMGLASLVLARRRRQG